MTAALFAAMQGGAVLARVRARLEAQGGVQELKILDGFSASETDVLLRLEREDPK